MSVEYQQETINESKLSTEEIIELYKSGLSSLKIAGIAGISSTSVINRLKKNGIERRGTEHRKYDYELIRQLYDEGMSLKELSERFSADGSSIWNVLKRTGNTRPRENLKGKDNPLWKDNKRTSDNYILNDAYKREHRAVIEIQIGRELFSWEEVHHIDGVRTNNNLSNLVIFPGREHARFHKFLSLRSMEINRENLEILCRKEDEYYFRFTTEDYELAKIKFPATNNPSRKPKIKKSCKIKDCQDISVTNGLCSKHYQRKRAEERGGWISGGGRTAKLKKTWENNQ